MRRILSSSVCGLSGYITIFQVSEERHGFREKNTISAHRMFFFLIYFLYDFCLKHFSCPLPSFLSFVLLPRLPIQTPNKFPETWYQCRVTLLYNYLSSRIPRSRHCSVPDHKVLFSEGAKIFLSCATSILAVRPTQPIYSRPGIRSQEVMLPERSVVPPLTFHDFTCVAELRTGTSPSRIPSMNTDLPPVNSKVRVVFKII